MTASDRLSEVGAALRWWVLLSGDRRFVTEGLLVAGYVLRVTTVSRRTWAAGQFAATDVSGGEIEGIEQDGRELD